MEKNGKYFLAGLAGLSGLLLALAYPGWSFDFGVLVWIGLVPLLYTLGQKSENSSKSHLFLNGFVAGIVYFSIVFRWFWSFYPLDTLGIKNPVVSFLIVLGIYSIAVIAMAAFLGIFGLISGQLSRKQTVWNGFAVASIFVLLEYARAYGYGLLWLGSGTVFGPHWTMGDLAYALASNNLFLKLSSYIGIYGISFIVVLVNLIFFKLLADQKNKRAITLCLIGIIILAITFGPKFLHQKEISGGKKIDFAIIQTNQPTKALRTPEEIRNSLKEQLDLLNKTAKNYPETQVIVFPEASDFFKDLASLLSGKQVQNYFSNLFKEPRLIISGARVIDSNSRAVSRVFSLDTKNDIVGYYDKRLLTPGGEFLPYFPKIAVNLISRIKVLQFKNLRQLEVGEKKTSTLNFKGQFSIAPIICSELLSPDLTRLTTKNSEIIAGMASYGIFHGQETFQRQNLAIIRFRAAENRKPVIMAANMGRSYVVTSRGDIQLLAPDQSAQILTGKVVLASQKSWYNRTGDVPILLGLLGLSVIFGLKFR